MSSDSSDSENLDLLREAADFQFINDSMFNAKAVTNDNSPSNQEKLPSLRKTNDEDEQFNLFRVTPEFRNYVSKHLSKILDKHLENKLRIVNDSNEPERKKVKSCVKLFSDSKHFVKIREKYEVPVSHNKRNSACLRNHLKTEINEDILRQVAVNPEDIVNRTEIKYWSNRSKAEIFKYQRTSNGTLVQIKTEFK